MRYIVLLIKKLELALAIFLNWLGMWIKVSRKLISYSSLNEIIALQAAIIYI